MRGHHFRNAPPDHAHCCQLPAQLASVWGECALLSIHLTWRVIGPNIPSLTTVQHCMLAYQIQSVFDIDVSSN